MKSLCPCTGVLSGRNPAGETTRWCRNVRAISNGMALIRALPDGRRFGVLSDFIGKQSEVRHPGDHGTLAVLRRFADAHQLPTTV